MRVKLFACAVAVVAMGIVGCEEIVGPIGDPVNLSYAPCLGAPDNPTWFAVQDGDGAWQRVNPSSSGTFDFTISSGKAGLAMYFPDGETTFGLYVVYATTEELQATLPACNGSVRTITGDVTGYATADNIKMAIGNSYTDIFGATQAQPAPFSIPSVDATATDLIATRFRTTSSGGFVIFEAFPNNVFLRRNVSGTTTSLVDFSSATEAGAPLQRDVNITNLLAGDELTLRSYVALPTTMANISVYETGAVAVAGSVLAHFYGIPSTRLNAGDNQMVFVRAARAVGATDEGRFSTFVFTNPVDQSLTLGPTLGPVTVTGTSRPSASYNVQTSYDGYYDVVFGQGNGTSARQVEVLATDAYLGGATSVTLTVPNLVGVSGFSSSWLLATGTASYWSFLATNADLTSLNNRPVTYQGADRSANFTP